MRIYQRVYHLSLIYYAHLYQISLDPETHSELRKSRTLSVLQGVPGIGYSQFVIPQKSHFSFLFRLSKAKKLVDAGCISISDLRTDKFASILTKTQLARFKYLGLEECRANRKEAEDVLVHCLYNLTVFLYSTEMFHQLFCRGSLDSKYELTLVGD